MRVDRASGVTGVLAAVTFCFGALAHCGGGDNGSPGPTSEAGSGGQDATMADVPVAPDGPDMTPPTDGGLPDAADTGTNQPDTGNPPDGGDGGAGTLDGSSDAAPDGELDSGADGGLDSGAEASPAPGPACDAQAACNTDASTVLCCSGYCIDTSKDPANCGQCGNACTTTQFCTGIACKDAIIANVCANASGTVVFDPYNGDNEAGAAMGAALAAYCVPAPTIVQASQYAAGVTEPVTGRPITGPGNTFIAGGGNYGQVGIGYMNSLSPLYLTGNGVTGQIRMRDGGAVVNVQVSSLTSQHDYFYVQLAVEPKSGTLCFSGVGMLSPGTAAAGYYVSSVMLPNYASYTSTWYVYEWDDTNGDFAPDNGDTFTPVLSGP
jgi:hypothetical protein